MQHDTGLYHRIVKENPDDVAKWIAERKCRFPTKENIEKTKAQKQEMFDRGERIPKQGKPFQNRDTSSSRVYRFQGKSSEINGNAKGFNQNRPPPRKTICKENKWRDPEAWKGDLPRFPGTAAFPSVEEVLSSDIMNGAHFSDEEDVVEMKAVEQIADKPLLSGVLALLATDYNSDMSDDDAENNSTPKSDSSVVQNQSKPNKVILLHKPEVCIAAHESNVEKTTVSVQEENECESGPEECAVDREDKSSIPRLSPERASQCKLNDKELNQNKLQERENTFQQRAKVPLMQRHQLSLLEKLLKNEIRHERNIILQSVRYVVKNNFFGIGSSIK